MSQGQQFMPLMVALAGISLLLADEGHTERGLELYALASRHPFVANSRWFEDVAGNQLAAMAANLPTAVVIAARRGTWMPLWENSSAICVPEAGKPAGHLTLCTQKAESSISRTVRTSPFVSVCALRTPLRENAARQRPTGPRPLRVHAWQVTGNEFFRTISEEILDVGDPAAADTKALLSVARDGYRPFQVVVLGPPSTEPLLSRSCRIEDL